jgi:ParB family transcriptional regulator, chromosome partitioning protein
MRIEVKEIEIAHLDLRYAHTRIRNIRSERRLCASLESHGQITPVVVVPQDPLGHILLDGYLRVAALKCLGQDRVMAEIHEGEQETVIQVMCRTQARRWEIFEHAELIKEIMVRFDYTQADMARFLGKSESFISRRLLVLKSLDDEMRDHVQKGRISIWVAARILAPLARANKDHARQVMTHIIAHPFTTREMMDWFKAYREANKKNRLSMVENPRMVLNALKVSSERSEAESLFKGPEGRWIKDIKIVTHMLKRLYRDVDVVFYEKQSNFDRRLLMTGFDAAVCAFNELMEKTRRIDAAHRNREYHPATAGKGDVHPENQPSFESFSQSRPACAGRHARP